MGNANFLQGLNQKSCFYGIVTIGLVTTAAYNYKKVYSLEQKVYQLNNAIDYSPSQFIDKVGQQVEQNGIENKDQYSQLTESEIIVKNILITGKSECAHPLTSKIDPSKSDLIYRCNYFTQKYSNDGLKKAFRQRSITTTPPKKMISSYVPEFQLVDGKISKTKLDVWIHQEPKICKSSINHKENKYTDKKLTFVEKIRSSLSTLFNILGLLFSKENNIVFTRGVEIGFNEFEVGIRAGGLLTIMGDVIYNFETKQLKMINPYTLIGDKVKYIQGLNDKIKDTNFYFIMCSVLSILFAYLFNKEYVKQKKSGRMLANQESDALKDIKKALIMEINDMKCDFCSQNNKQIINKPCGHLVYCKECNKKLQLQQCPKCYVSIQESIEIYIS